jgi:hypothetical protein
MQTGLPQAAGGFGIEVGFSCGFFMDLRRTRRQDVLPFIAASYSGAVLLFRFQE